MTTTATTSASSPLQDRSRVRQAGQPFEPRLRTESAGGGVHLVGWAGRGHALIAEVERGTADETLWHTCGP
ncbi:MAG TPA: hypothetical protein VME46_24515 [Acidimicrobiales bacterium]|nr:hypothetical protein [Acidimicrobiales bacterium]